MHISENNLSKTSKVLNNSYEEAVLKYLENMKEDVFTKTSRSGDKKCLMEDENAISKIAHRAQKDVEEYSCGFEDAVEEEVMEYLGLSKEDTEQKETFLFIEKTKMQELKEYRDIDGANCRYLERGKDSQETTEPIGRYKIAFEINDELYYCFVAAISLDESLGNFVRNHPNIAYDLIVEHIEIRETPFS